MGKDPKSDLILFRKNKQMYYFLYPSIVIVTWLCSSFPSATNALKPCLPSEILLPRAVRRPPSFSSFPCSFLLCRINYSCIFTRMALCAYLQESALSYGALVISSDDVSSLDYKLSDGEVNSSLKHQYLPSLGQVYCKNQLPPSSSRSSTKSEEVI